MPDAQPQSPEITRAKLVKNIAQAVVGATAAAELELDFTRWEVEFVIGDQNFRRRNLEKARQRSDRLAREVHESLGFEQPDGLSIERRARQHAVVAFFHHRCHFERPGQRIDPPESGVVAGALIFRPGVAQADKQFDHGNNLSMK